MVVLVLYHGLKRHFYYWRFIPAGCKDTRQSQRPMTLTTVTYKTFGVQKLFILIHNLKEPTECKDMTKIVNYGIRSQWSISTLESKIRSYPQII